MSTTKIIALGILIAAMAFIVVVKDFIFNPCKFNDDLDEANDGHRKP